MAGNSPVILRVLASAVAATERASKIIKEVMDKGDLGLVDKGKNDPQTEADRSAQKCIVQTLVKKFPEIMVIGEEELTDSSDIPEDWIVKDENPEILSKDCPPKYKDILVEDIVVWVDPLDGTREFTTGFLDNVTILVGIAYSGKPIAGIINQPYYMKDGHPVGRVVWGMKDVGYGGFELKAPPENKMIVTVTRSHSDQDLESALAKLKPDEIVRVGGAGHKVLLVLEGRVHAYIVHSKGLKRWDTCACEAILDSVGGILTDTSGTYYIYDRDVSYNINDGIIAVQNQETHEVLLKLFKDMNKKEK